MINTRAGVKCGVCKDICMFFKKSLKKKETDYVPDDKGGVYIISIKDAAPPYRDPSFELDYIDKNPFGFNRQDETIWEWRDAGDSGFSLSPEPPGLQVTFWNTDTALEEQVLVYIQAGIDEPTVIVCV